MSAKKSRAKAAGASTTRRQKSDAKSAAKSAPGAVVRTAADGAPLVVPEHGNGMLKQGGDHPRPGRPRNEVRQLAAQLLKDRLLPRAVEVISESKDGDLHLRAIEKFVEVAHNEKLRLAQLAAGAAQAGKPGALAAVQVHVNGPPTGVERQD